MKYLKILAIPVCFFIFSACDTEIPEPEDTVLNHDSDNLDSPRLPANTWEVGARFTSNQARNFQGEEIESLDFYIYNKPDSAWVAIYEYNGTDTPGSLLYSSVVTSNITSQAWNNHQLTTNVSIDGGVWITFGYKISATKQVIGCDPGPAKSGGDMLTSSTSGWTTLFDLYGPDVNWNLRANIAE